ncbi:hypothetical protein E3226_012035 (plasmid) [Legionella geestiana]|uniref:hypothetical protein n=1 Tax=Legionella geestiana TaxID=45065 RepID=UPI0010924C43|nr:hypothetical protein [Legionella geestiana]QDQ41209.1 hypothetical protein E3226_012035 [Legionella geestiana]
MKYKYTLEFSAQRHAELLFVAERMLDIIKVDKERPELLLLRGEPKYNLFVALDYSISALEAFIAQIRYIITGKMEKTSPNFWDMFREVKKLLEELSIRMPHLEDEGEIYPFDGYREARKTRNIIHHVRPGYDNVKSYERTGDIHAQEDADAISEMFASWVNVSSETVEKIHDDVKTYIYEFSYLLFEYPDEGIPELQKKALHRLLENPFSKLSIATGNKELVNQ